MQIIINHLTRMQPGYICAAGVDTATMSHIRPVYGGARLTEDLLTRHGGPLDIAVILDIGKPRNVGHPPEIEDRQPDWLYVRGAGRASGSEFRKMLQAVAQESLNDIFGPELARRGTKAAIDLNKGRASLGCVTCRKPPSLKLVARPPRPAQLRIWVTDPSLGDLDLPVTDIRLYGPDHQTPDARLAEKLNERFRRKERVILAVGVGRPFPPPPAADSAHWLQVNNIHFAEGSA
jgi:hypothetical protein